MTYLYLALGAFSGALFHFAFRKSLDHGGRSSVFLFLQTFFACIFVTVLNVRPDNFFELDTTTLSLGLFEGVLYVAMMWVLAKAFQSGPPGLTVAMMNSATIVPAVLMALLFGSAFGHHYTFLNGLGSTFVLLGLFWASRSQDNAGSVLKWAFFATCAFLAHSLYLSIMQWRVLLLNFESLPFFTPALPPASAHWFQSLIFFSAACIQAVMYYTTDGKKFTRRELLWATLGGAANGSVTYCLVRATEIATDVEKGMIFPITGVASIFLCNLWGKWVYKERIKWAAVGICLFGLLIGTW